MHLGFDGTIWGGEESGVAIATRRLFLHLCRNPGPHRLTAFVNRAALEVLGPARGDPRVRIVIVHSGSRGARVVWQQLRLPALARAHRLDLLYNPSYTVPLACRTPLAVTIHDLIAWRRPDLCRHANVLHFRILVGASARRARVITVPTEVVACDVAALLGVPRGKIHVVPWGADAEIVPVPRSEARAAVRAWFGIDHRYVLHVGTDEPKKNLLGLCRALRDLDMPLVVAGPGGWGGRSRRRGLERDPMVIPLGWVPVERLGALYAAAELLAFPSWIEGFGLPALEAMACGTPVVASDAPALREVCDGAALHVPADETDALSLSIRRVLADPALREQLADRGRARAARLNWQSARDRFLAAVADVPESPSS